MKGFAVILALCFFVTCTGDTGNCDIVVVECPCGNSNNTVINKINCENDGVFCFKCTFRKLEYCSKFLACRECEDGLDGCKTCPVGRDGIHCISRKDSDESVTENYGNSDRAINDANPSYGVKMNKDQKDDERRNRKSLTENYGNSDRPINDANPSYGVKMNQDRKDDGGRNRRSLTENYGNLDRAINDANPSYGVKMNQDRKDDGGRNRRSLVLSPFKFPHKIPRKVLSKFFPVDKIAKRKSGSILQMFGLNQKQGIHKSRSKRTVLCSVPEIMKTGELKCTTLSSKVRCSLRCKVNYTLHGKKEMEFFCINGHWRPTELHECTLRTKDDHTTSEKDTSKRIRRSLFPFKIPLPFDLPELNLPKLPELNLPKLPDVASEIISLGKKVLSRKMLQNFGQKEKPDRISKRSTSCSFPETMKTAEVKCTMFSSKVKCVISCIWGFTFGQVNEKTIICHEGVGVWTPSGFEECTPYVNCTLELVLPGDVHCDADTIHEPLYCDIICEDYDDTPASPMNRYECQSDGSWDPPLPTCVRKATSAN